MPTPHSSRLALSLAAVLLCVGLGAVQTAAASTKKPPGAAAPAKKLPGKVTFREAPSSEKPADRAKRLKRECKGRPNAGMCLGHAS
jgi:hypothetical protein